MNNGLTPEGATRMANLMRAYWENRDVAQKRRGDRHFREFLTRLVNKSESLDPFGDYSSADQEVFVLGTEGADLIRKLEPSFEPVFPTGQSYDMTDIYDGFSYMMGFTTGVSRFLALTDTVWVPYIGATDTNIPDIPSIPDPETESE